MQLITKINIQKQFATHEQLENIKRKKKPTYKCNRIKVNLGRTKTINVSIKKILISIEGSQRLE